MGSVFTKSSKRFTAALLALLGVLFVSTCFYKVEPYQQAVVYRLGRIRNLSGLSASTDSELYLQLKTALVIDQAASVLESWNR